MTRTEFRELCLKRPVILDGATGTELIKRGLPTGVCPEKWVYDNPQSITEVQQAYRNAGSDIVYACTFGGNLCKLEEFQLDAIHDELNSSLAKLSISAVGDGMAFGDLAPTGNLIEPFGPMKFEECVSVYRKQAQALVDAGVHGIVIETMMDIQEARAALIGVREVTQDLPVIVTMTYGEEGRTLTGTDPVTAVITLQSLGADAVGCNCSAGPETMIEWIAQMKPYATVPLLAKPNAGQPKLVNGETIFDMQPDEYASYFTRLVEAGANILGGCCGSTPDHIAAVKQTIGSMSPVAPALESISAVSSAQGVTMFGAREPFVVIGERINPTGKKALQAQLREGKLNMVRQFALEQTQAGAGMIDVNMGLSGINEKEMMLKAVNLIAPLVKTPLCLDTTDPEVMEAALRLNPGRALINSVSAEKDRIEKMLPLVKKYGAMYILLPVTDEEVPEELEKRKEVTLTVIDEAKKLGIPLSDAVIDGLVMSVSSSPDAPNVTADFISWCACELGANTSGGVSNVSFGMPERKWLNMAFLGLLIGRGLNSAIINPSVEMMMGLKFASDALTARDKKFANYLANFSGATKKETESKVQKTPLEKAFDAVLYGEEDTIAEIVESAISENTEPQSLVDDALIPAIVRVGELYDKKEYFLPQLMMSAETMSKGFKALEKYLQKDSAESAGKVIMATVKGDIHDIGKNIVCLMLKNYGFEVIDLGKDIDAQTILDAAEEHQAKIIGLSALMTTTMGQMETVIKAALEAGKSDLKFMVGGAVVDKNYADEIGAAYAEDAVEAVRVVQQLAKS